MYSWFVKIPQIPCLIFTGGNQGKKGRKKGGKGQVVFTDYYTQSEFSNYYTQSEFSNSDISLTIMSSKTNYRKG